jgi:SAM-dependent methyltransferase
MVSERLFRRCYPGHWHDGSAAFYGWVRQSLRPDMRILNLGAGPATGNAVRTLRGEVSSVIGADPDPAVLHNTELDEAYVIEGRRLPFPDDAFDLVYADYVLEHVEHPGEFLGEAWRVLKRGAPFFFRTPNRRHYVALIARATPHRFHVLVANRARGLPPDAHEPWVTFYRLNGVGRIRRAARAAGFGSCELRLFEPEPSYLMFSAPAFLLGVAYERLVNATDLLSGLRANIFGKLVK